MKNKVLVVLALIGFMCCFLKACFLISPISLENDSRYGLNLEVNLDTTLPTDGELLYEVFATMGRDAKQYAVIQYEAESGISDCFSWKAMTPDVWNEVERLTNSVETWQLRNEEAPIPADLRPSDDMLYVVVGDNLMTLADPYAILVFSPDVMRLYILVNLT